MLQINRLRQFLISRLALAHPWQLLVDLVINARSLGLDRASPL